MKKLLTLLLCMCLLCGLSLMACGGDDKKEDTISYTITYNNTTIPSQEVSEGTILQEPTEPTKEKYIFVGWFTDSDCTNEAAFPITINSDTNLYAKFYSFETAFMEARDATVGDSIDSYQYDYTTNVTASVKTSILNSSLSGTTTGTSTYNKNSVISFYDKHVNSGALFPDGTKYQIRQGTTLQKITKDSDGELSKFESEEVDNNYKFDSSNFAKAIFEYEDGDLKEVSKTNNANEFKLQTSFNFSKGLSVASSILNNRIVQRLIGNLPEQDVETAMYVTFNGGQLATYKYVMKIDISSISFNLTYSLTFKNVGKNNTINPDSFGDIKVTTSDLQEIKGEIDTYITDYKAKTHSSYDYKVKTDVDYGITTLGIGTTIQGDTNRKVDGSNVYFHNLIELDTDLKNGDLYDGVVEDVKIKKTKLSSGEVWLIKKNLLTDDTKQVNDYVANANDSYYVLDGLSVIDSYTYAKKEVSGTTTTYTLGLSNLKTTSLLTYFNNAISMSPYENVNTKAKAFGTFDSDSVLAKKAIMKIVVTNGEIEKIDILLKGDISTKFEDSRDFTTEDDADFKLDISITMTTEGNDFEPYETVKEAK